MANEVAWDNVVTVKGDTLDDSVRAWLFKDSDGNAIDLTGQTAALTVRADFEEADTVTPILELTSAGGTLTITAGDGKIELSVSAASYAGVAPGTYVFDLETTTSGGAIKTRVRGEWKILPEATRA